MSDTGRSAAGWFRDGGKRDRHRLRPALQVLEGRRLLATFTVTIPVDTLIPPTNQPLPGTLRWAVEEADAATSPSTIDFELSNIPSITMSLGTLDVGNPSEPITIKGPGANLLSIVGNDASTVFDCTIGTTSISGLTITGGSSSGYGGGLDNGGQLTLSDCTISGNSASSGGGLYNDSTATLAVDDCTISGNTAQTGGGLIIFGGATLTDCTISGNSAALNGGGMDNNVGGLTLAIDDCTISGNSAKFGGGLFNLAGEMLSDCTISGNSATNGGGLYQDSGGASQLTDTIVAGNLGGGDIGGSDPSGVTGTYNLIGPGGSGGIQGGSDGNIVLASLTGLGLTPLGSYGGPTQTMALLPGSLAIGAGTPIGGITTDQRGEPIGASVDIGAFQSQGFTLTPASVSTPQGAALGAAFAQALAVTVTANNPVEPVVGGVVTFGLTPGPTGASAILSGASAIIESDGVALITATASFTDGPYLVTASTAGAAPAEFHLSNLVTPTVGLSASPGSVAYGQPVTLVATVTGPGTPGGTITFLDGSIPLGMVPLDASGQATLTVADLAPGAIAITASYGGDDDFFAGTSPPASVSVTMAAPTVALTASAGSVTFGQAVTLVATVTGPATASGTVTFLDGSTPLGAVPIDASGQATLTVADLPLGAQTITASYGGDADFLGGTSPPASVSVARAATDVVLVPHPVFRKKKVVAIGLDAEVEPMSSGGVEPTGTVTFMVKKKSLGTASLVGGEATLTVKAGAVLNKAITIEYGGDADYLSSTGAPPVVTRSSLKDLARPMVAVLERTSPGRRGHRGRLSRSEVRHGS